MRTHTEALKEIRDRLTYFCLRTDGKYDPPWVTELIGIIDESVTERHAVGNAAAMRDALLKLRAEIGLFYNNEWIPYDAWKGCDDVISHALSAPPRNCDVGTAEEQAERHSRFCISQGGHCKQCPAHARAHNGCVLAWAQMPYEAQEGGAQ